MHPPRSLWLLEFGETPSSSLSLDEFMTVDLEEEQDPPSFKAARKKDHHDRLQKIIDGEEMGQNLTALQLEIEKELKEISTKKKVNILGTGGILGNEDESEARELNNFVQKSTIKAIKECMNQPGDVEQESEGVKPGLAPSFSTLGLRADCVSNKDTSSPTDVGDGELIIDDLDDDELNQYIMTDREAKFKDNLWMKINENYLQQQKEREEKLAREKEEGKPEKKRKKYSSKKAKNVPAANSAGEAFEKMLQEKKMSTKINYDVLKSLTLPKPEITTEEKVFSRVQSDSKSQDKENNSGGDTIIKENPEEIEEMKDGDIADDAEGEAEYLEDGEADVVPTEISLSQLLNQHGNDEAEAFGDYEDDEEY